MVAGRSDVPSLNESVACEVAGITPAKRKDWVKRGLVEQPATGARLGELQVLELALVQELHHLLGPSNGSVAWRQLQELLNTRLPAGQLDLVFDHRFRKVTLAACPSQVADAVRTKRPMSVIPLAELIGNVREAFRRLALAPTAPARRSRGVGARQGNSDDVH
jgi:hypothetical protein